MYIYHIYILTYWSFSAEAKAKADNNKALENFILILLYLYYTVPAIRL